MTPRRRVALLLGAGGVAGHAFHAGVLRALHETTGWDPRESDLVVGTSAGSVVGVGLRAGLGAADLYARVVGEPLSAEGQALLEPLPDGERRFEATRRTTLPTPASLRLLAGLLRRPWRARPGLVLAGLLPEGRIDPMMISGDTDVLVDAARKDLRRLWVTAVRLRDGRRVVFGRDQEPLPTGWTWGQAVAASCAIPGFFAPVSIDGVRMVDGGAHSPTNADLLTDEPLDAAVVVSPMSSARSVRHRSIDAPVRTLYRLRLAAELAGLRRRGVPVLVFQPTAPVLRAAGLNAMDPSLRVPVARASYEAARRRCERAEFLRQAAPLCA